ncbi:MAG: hypothetical protein Q8P24_15185, partial [Desulfobacterales bacterium]|nr:hypothetical protein [Desulfobacterales bacterium]
TGESLIEGGNVPAAKTRAIEEALRKAVEQGLGVFISSESLVKNYQVIEDKMFSNSQGYVKSYDVVSEKQLGNRYRVSISAVVSLEIIKKDLMALAILRQQIHNPRLMIVIGTRQGEVDDAARSARVSLEKRFAENHFDLIDPATSQKLHNNTKLLLDVTKETVVAAKIGLEHHAEVVLTGVISSEQKGKTNAGFDAASSNLILRVIDPTTAKIFASTQESAGSVGSSASEALSGSGSKTGEKAAAYASKEIIKWWQELKSSGVAYKITLKNILEYPVAMIFEDGVKEIDNIVSLNERVFGGGFLECDVVYKGEKSALTRAIFNKLYGKPGFEKLNVQTSHGNNIILSR